jgi:predicted NBD/HSP70 family sugar kinase/RimJ/RimL family protein N-acetyltransferase
LGGTKIELAAIDGGGAIELRRREPTPAGDYAATVEAIARLVESAEAELGERASVGVATPGALSLVDGRIKNANSTCLNGRPLREDLEKRLGRPVRLANDANCFALSEAVDGAARDAQVVFGVILGTGVGGGVVVRQRVVTGANAIAGEWGHNALPLPGPDEYPLPLCYCGRRGCIETYLSGPAMAADHGRIAGARLAAEEIVARATAGDAACAATLQRYEQRLARALASVINVLDPDAIVLGGGLSNIPRLYERIPAMWREHVFSDEVRTALLAPAHGDSSGVRGAAWLWQPTELQGFAAAGDEAVTLREIDSDNIDLVADLRVAESQKFHVASVGKTFWQAGQRKDMWVRAIYAGAEPVGMVALVERRPPPGEERFEIYFARLLVDQRYQGRGFGREAARLAIEHARSRPGCRGMKISHMPSNREAGRLYEGFGFRYTGTTDEDGEVEMQLEFNGRNR